MNLSFNSTRQASSRSRNTPITRLSTTSPPNSKSTQTFGIFYGWVMLILVAVLQMGTSPGQTFGVSVFNPAIRETLQLSISELTGAYLLASALAAVPMPFIGWIMDRYGLRRSACVILILLGFACGWMSQVSGIVTLTFGFFLLRSCGQGALTLVAANTLPMWFHRRLGVVSGLSGLGISLAVAVMPIAYLLLITSFGWRTSYLILAVTNWLFLLPLVLLVYRNRPEDMGQQIDGEEVFPVDSNLNSSVEKSSNLSTSSAVGTSSTAALSTTYSSMNLWQAWRTPAYWITMGITVMWAMIGTAIVFNIVPLFASRGLTEAQAAGTFPTFALCMATMQLFGGWLADRYPLNRLLSLSALGLLLGVIVAWQTNNLWMAHGYAILFGASQGLLTSVNNTLWPRYFGREHLGKIRSSAWTATVAGCSVGPFIMAYSVDYLGSFDPSLYLFMGLLCMGVCVAMFAVPPNPSSEQLQRS